MFTREQQLKLLPSILEEFGDAIAKEYLDLEPNQVHFYILGLRAGLTWSENIYYNR